MPAKPAQKGKRKSGFYICGNWMQRVLISIPCAERRIAPSDGKPYIAYKIVLVDPNGVSGFIWRRYTELYELSQRVYTTVLPLLTCVQVATTFPRLDLPEFPSRIIFDFFSDGFDPAVVEKRRSGLELYLRALVGNLHVYNSPIVGSFFRLLEPLPASEQPRLSPVGASMPTQVTPGGPSPPFMNSPPMLNAIFQLPRPPVRRLPDIVVLPPNQEECFAASMMDTVKQTLIMLSQLHAEIESTPEVAAKLQALENWRARIEPRVRQLQEHIYLALRIANNLHPQQHAELSAYFAGSLEVMKRALQWAQTIEESIFMMLDGPPRSPAAPLPAAASPLTSPPSSSVPAAVFSPAPVRPTDAPTAALSIQEPQPPPLLPLPQPIAVPPASPPVLPAAVAGAYPADVAPQLAGAYMPAVAPAPSRASEESDLPVRVKRYEEEGEALVIKAVEEGDVAVQAQVDALRERLQREMQACSVPGLEEFAQRCASARQYLDQNIALVRRLRTGTGSDDVERYEAELFRLLHLSSNTDPTNIAESTTLRNGLLTLMKELGVYKSVLTKRNAPEDAPVRRRLEDLQENVANFEAEVTLKFGWERGLADKAIEMMKNKQIEEAKKKHEHIANDIYEL